MIFAALCIKRTKNVAESRAVVNHDAAMQDKTINSALLALRKNLIRECGEGLDHVEALLAMRGVPMPAVLPAKRDDVARKGHMARFVVSALKDGPQGVPTLGDRVMAEHPSLTRKAAYNRVYQALLRLERRGMAVRDFGPDRCLWEIQV